MSRRGHAPYALLYEQLELDRFWEAQLPDSREGTRWRHILQTLVVYRLLDPGSEWRLHRLWFEQSKRRARAHAIHWRYDSVTPDDGRGHVPGGTCFFTANTGRRRTFLTGADVRSALREAIGTLGSGGDGAGTVHARRGRRRWPPRAAGPCPGCPGTQRHRRRIDAVACNGYAPILREMRGADAERKPSSVCHAGARLPVPRI